jgi:kynureninase
MDLDSLGVDFAVGGSVKWLCGGPGAGYCTSARSGLGLEPVQAGWAGHADPFEFETGRDSVCAWRRAVSDGDAERPGALFRARRLCRSSRRLASDAIRQRSLQMTRRLIDAASTRAAGLQHADRRRRTRRSVVIDVPDGAAVTRRCWRSRSIVDYRPNAGIRIAPHFYTTDAEIDIAIEAIAALTDR